MIKRRIRTRKFAEVWLNEMQVPSGYISWDPKEALR